MCEFIKGHEGQKKSKARSKLEKIYNKEFADYNDDDDSDSADSNGSQFEKDHNEKFIFERAERDKIVISVIDSGIGIKKKDRLKLFKLFGCL